MRFPVDAQVFFSRPERYLARNVEIAVRTAIVRELLVTRRQTTVLDLGCGDGSISLGACPSAEKIVLVDRSAAMLSRAREQGGLVQAHVEYVNSDILSYTSSVRGDVVLAVGVLAHVVPFEAVVERAAFFTRRGGVCVLQVTDSDHLLAQLIGVYQRGRARLLNDDNAYVPRPLTFRQVHEAARVVGLRLVAVRRFMPSLPGTKRLPRGLVQPMILGISRVGVTGWGSEVLAVFER
jgi:ubiquinone/menaquinone biosynthesis C-methylase UbiE